ncbi:hypothetical protein [Alteromonas oceanisediminis]|uniref:hypothetical protein n=1 Tax=Alteromonas oceanisediminis TaxID=2836180 RepID=UPI001BD9ED89|nr:hypothetical protein [Alteromonas oceanisediminis]MBT0586042.1 hypothetical protein [Alteromonas oceanisediminis]
MIHRENVFRSLSSVLVATLFLLSGSAIAQQGTLSDAVEKCSKESNSLKRLVCFDNVAKSVRQYAEGDVPLRSEAMLRARSAGNVAKSDPAPADRSGVVLPTDAAPTASSEVQEFGLEHRRDTEKMIDKLYASVVKITTTPRSRKIIELDNGQVWRQNDGSALKIDVGDRVYVERGVLGAFYLGKDSLNRRMKVKRDQ